LRSGGGLEHGGWRDWFARTQAVNPLPPLARALAKTTEPSYGYFLSRGETAWPEYWDDNCPSRIHTCYTGIAAAFIKGLGGIREDPDHLGYQAFVIKPALVADLTFADATTRSLYGPIHSRWEKHGGIVHLAVTIPVNSTATVYVPATDVSTVTEGGRPLAQAAGVRVLGRQGSYAVLAVQSGDYRFASQ
jgi:alpha-L-rhamnosidase